MEKASYGSILDERHANRGSEPRARGHGCSGGRIGETTGRFALLGEYWCGRCQVRCRRKRGQSAVDLMRLGALGNNRPICVVGGVLVWPLSGSLPAQAWTIGGRFDAIGRPCDRISARASVFRTATARHNQVEELDRREPFLILPFRPREMFSAFACCYPAQEPGATKWCRPRDSRMHPLP